MACKLWCVDDNFNVIRNLKERHGTSIPSLLGHLQVREFNHFIDDMELIDVPIVGRKFTWFSVGGKASNIIDICLVCLRWLARWPMRHSMFLNAACSITIL